MIPGTHAGRRGALQPFVGDLVLRRARTHEFVGPARRTLAMMLAAKTQGPVFWIVPAWTAERLHAEGMWRFADPARFIFLTPQRAEDVFWAMEEALRSGIVPLVVADIPGPPGLTQVRRLHLAAETGQTETARAPLGVLLTADASGAPGVESRWHLDAAHGPQDMTEWALTRKRSRTDPPKTWSLRATRDGFGLFDRPVTAK
jgi:protein ImuA